MGLALRLSVLQKNLANLDPSAVEESRATLQEAIGMAKAVGSDHHHHGWMVTMFGFHVSEDHSRFDHWEAVLKDLGIDRKTFNR